MRYLNFSFVPSQPDVMCVSSIVSLFKICLPFRNKEKMIALRVHADSDFTRFTVGMYAHASLKFHKEKDLKCLCGSVAFARENPLVWL